MNLKISFLVILLNYFSLAGMAHAKCLNGYQDIIKYAGASVGCSGYFIRPDIFLTAGHCAGKGPKYLTAVGGLFSEDTLIRATTLFQSSQSDIALLKTETKHPYLTEDDFKCIVLSNDLRSSSGPRLFVVGTSMNPIPMPLVYECKEPTKGDNHMISCQAVVNKGQSGSALIGYDTNKDRIYVYGSLAESSGINYQGTFYAKFSQVTAIDEIIAFLKDY